MSWLSERLIQYRYVSSSGEERIYEFPAKEDAPEKIGKFKKAEMLPYTDMNLMTKVQFERNGRVGYDINLGDGKHIRRSATREQYEHKVGNTGIEEIKRAKREGQKIDWNPSVYTKPFADAVEKAKQKKTIEKARAATKFLKGGK